MDSFLVNSAQPSHIPSEGHLLLWWKRHIIVRAFSNQSLDNLLLINWDCVRAAMLQTLSQLPKLEEVSLEVSWWMEALRDPSCIRILCQIPSLKRLGNVVPDIVASMDDRRLSCITSLKVRPIVHR